MAKCLPRLTAIVLCGTLSTAMAGEALKVEELRILLVGNTEKAQYRDDGMDYKYWGFYGEDGNVKGTGDAGEYSAKYEIRADGCLYRNYDYGNEVEGCYYYEHVTGNTYGVAGPNDFASLVEILAGDPKTLTGTRAGPEPE